jgi:Helix-turn-helix domain
MLNRTFGCVRVMWNRTLATRRARWQAERKGTSSDGERIVNPRHLTRKARNLARYRRRMTRRQAWSVFGVMERHAKPAASAGLWGLHSQPVHVARAATAAGPSHNANFCIRHMVSLQVTVPL